MKQRANQRAWNRCSGGSRLHRPLTVHQPEQRRVVAQFASRSKLRGIAVIGPVAQMDRAAVS